MFRTLVVFAGITGIFSNEVPLFIRSQAGYFAEKRFINMYRTLVLSKAVPFYGKLGAASMALSQHVSGAGILSCQLRGSIWCPVDGGDDICGVGALKQKHIVFGGRNPGIEASNLRIFSLPCEIVISRIQFQYQRIRIWFPFCRCDTKCWIQMATLRKYHFLSIPQLHVVFSMSWKVKKTLAAHWNAHIHLDWAVDKIINFSSFRLTLDRYREPFDFIRTGIAPEISTSWNNTGLPSNTQCFNDFLWIRNMAAP